MKAEPKKPISKVIRAIILIACLIQIGLALNLVWNRVNDSAFGDPRLALKVVCQALILLMYPAAVLVSATGASDSVFRQKYGRLSAIIFLATLFLGAWLL